MPPASAATMKHPASLNALEDQRLDPGERVLGIVIGDEPRAYSLAEVDRSGGQVHDLVAGQRIDVEVHQGTGDVARAAVPVQERSTTNWGAWTHLHPDTSLWRPAAVAEAETTRSAAAIRVKESRDYNTAISCALTTARLTSTRMDPPGLFVISGVIENVDDEAVHHVVLRYELLDDKERVVYRDEGLNRSAEALAAPKLTDAGAVLPIAPGATDTFRMIFLTEELPGFDHTRVTVARVY